MKRLIVSTIALAMGTGSALAADLPSLKAPVVVPPPPLIWTGFYAGLNIGGGWENNNNNNQWSAFWDPRVPFGTTFGPLPRLGVNGGGGGPVPPYTNGGFIPNLFFLPNGNNGNGSQGGVIGGAQIGYNFQFNPSIVIGVETDFQGTSIGNHNNNWSSTFYPSPFLVDGTFGRVPGALGGGGGFVPGASGFLVPLWGNGSNWHNQSLANIGTVRGRVGWLFTPSLLVYGTGGFAYAGSWFFNSLNVGWTAGGGLEWMFAPNWSAKIEYLYAQFRNDNNYNNGSGYGWGGGWNYSWNQSVNIVRVGVNYHFNWAQPAPVLHVF